MLKMSLWLNHSDEYKNRLIPPSFTNDDQLQAQAYVDQRALLFQMWDLATIYPNIASKIEVRVRKADPRRDYRYDERRFGDAAIVVTLAWLDAAEACRFLSCTPRFARTGECKHGDEPRIFPSGDHTTLSACEPSCFLLRDSQRARNFGDIADLRERFRSTVYHVMSAHTGEYERRDESLADTMKRSKRSLDDQSSPLLTVINEQQQQQQQRSRLPDMPQLSYDEQHGSCEIANSTLFTYATLPYMRSETHNVCRQDNFLLGDDIVRAPLYDPISDTTTHELTARHSRGYCEAFDKTFDSNTHTCHVPWWEHALSYTFVGTALVRLGRHAAYGGDRCDEIFPTNADRPATDEYFVPANIRSRANWFGDVDRHGGWCLPPPNILLSDLGIRDLDQVWSNRNGGIIMSLTEHMRHKEEQDRLSVRNDAMPAALVLERQRQERQQPRNDPQQHAQRSLSTQLPLNRPFAGSIGRIDHTDTLDDNTDKGDRVLDFDEIYERIHGSIEPDNPAWMILKELPEIGGQILAEYTARKLTKLAYNRALRFVGQRLAGTSSRVLLGMGVRVAAARMLSTVLVRYSTRVMLALGSVASGVGAVIGLIEAITILLDVMLMFGWDPGKYNSEFDNSIYDDMAIGYVQQRRVTRVAAMNPYLLLIMFQSDDVNQRTDESMYASAPQLSVDRFAVESVAQAPWYFAPFRRAVDALVTDLSPATAASTSAETHTSTSAVRRDDSSSSFSSSERTKLYLAAETEIDPLTRMRPIVNDNPFLCSMLWSMHYFRHCEINSLGQQVLLGGAKDVVRINDAMIERAVRDNELAAMLSSATDDAKRFLPRAQLLGTAKRNLWSKIMNSLTYVAIAAAGFGALIIGAFVTILFGNGGVALIVIFLANVLLLLVPLVSAITFFEVFGRDAQARSYDVRRDDNTKEDQEVIVDRVHEGATNMATTEIDQINTICECIANLLRTDTTVPLSNFLLSMMIDQLRVELRVIISDDQ